MYGKREATMIGGAVDGRPGSCNGETGPAWRRDTMEQSAQPTACPDCHALTDDLSAHQRWHSRLVHDIAVAVDKENKRREAAAPR